MSRFRAAFALVLASASLFAAACGSPPPATTPPEGTAAPDASGAPTTAPDASGAPAAPPAAWKDDLSMQEKAAFMKHSVVPALGPVFKAGDATKYASFGCATCHGPSLKDTKEALPRLTLKDGNITSFADKPEVSKYMAEKIVPEMAKVLGKPAYDPKTHQGFGCGGCHAIDMK